jgi:DNA-binding response OmpR family regulator
MSSSVHPVTSNANLPQILLIEDNPNLVNYLQTCLAGTCHTRIARNGKIGIELALEHIPDLILPDVMMPEKDGYQVCDTLKNDERTSHIPIIILTAKADAASRMAGLHRGADTYWAKPFDLEELLVQVERLLTNQRRIAAHFSKSLKSGATTTAAPEPEPAIAEAVLVEDAFL